MADSFKFLMVLCLTSFVYSKELHLKQNVESKDKDAKGFMNLFNNEEFTKNERFARHIKAVTESVLEHIIQEIKHQYYSTNYNPNSPITRLMKNLTKELKRNEKAKMMKVKERKKKINKNKNKIVKNKLKLTTAKVTT